MPVLKPVRGIRLNKSHPLARSLVGYWLLNEGSGNKVFDLSGNGNTGTFNGTAPAWSSGKFGSAISLPGTDEYIGFGDVDAVDGLSNMTVVVCYKANSMASTHRLATKEDGESGDEDGWAFQLNTAGKLEFRTDNAGTKGYKQADSGITGTIWHQYTAILSGGTTVSLYVDELEVIGTVTGTIGTPGSHSQPLDFGRLYWGGSYYYLDGMYSHVMIFNRALSASEIALLYREPFCMLDRAWRPGLIGGQIVELAGTATGTSDVTAILSSIRGLTASTGGFTAVDGSLGIMGESPPEMERNWFREALFNGMTANAFKLGTSLSLGWFWVRVTGCSVLYRGAGMGEIDFANILAVSEQNVSEISPPSYISHNNGSTYFYVVRRFNNCGYQEHTLAAAVKVSIGSSGELAEPQPNNISSSKVEQVDSNKVRLTWFYCPLEQDSRPVSFNVYYDDRTGQIEYQNPLATIGYKGRKFYSFQSSALEAGKYLFAIRAEDARGLENISLARLKIQLDTLNPDAIDILRAEAV